MFLVVLLTVLALWGMVATLVELRRDGYRAIPTDWSRAIPDDATGGSVPGSAEIRADDGGRRPGEAMREARRPRPARAAGPARPRRRRAGQLPSARS